ncbi:MULTISPECIES: DNA polymerase III subunit gamma/tau [unclassified Pseudoalteromonas]|uniref:DNA polymerase III subunit gamma/tau n=1 Tax=unclassified Pseudoalteromonas TaxID=194690 RepID=UPI0025B3BF6E|nr:MULTISPECIES: DNA polymerase III subunit gamma/tau [unclassified Pseudoalteromonas]MDN3377122.1 DNA polymerase III subunit gamma/tau [Pseudoalteromonas sp. APC 3893]MDN3385710.1 DNA polymerase III subunit gamma/tau [Pseudoalteromonas sp. APC 4017]
MSYQVLARKWRPQTFHELVGQSHVKQALVNALTQNRLHHAYLFTGTRGVGKTTIARIFAKSLNCDEGISSEPCGQCSSCKDIESGRYIDLLEIDAASRTKVEDTREILDNVQYAPTRGRYKVYLIDEVHMLSKHSFNALLKTLEEPPEHVKFLLATTDPQKLPVTILSRCLQFNLNALSQSEILQQLEYVLGEEQLSFETQALQIIAKAADGSMRDALSLTDQAIAQTNGNIQHQSVQNMLGLMDNHYSQHLLAALLAQDGALLMTQIEQIASQNPQYNALLDDLIGLTHLIQLTQLVPDAAKLDEHNAEFIQQVAQASDSQQTQIYYQLLLNGKKDLQWAPEPRLGFEMIMLRLLAFEPAGMTSTQAPPSTTQPIQNKAGRASALRDIINKNKAVQQSPSVDTNSDVQSLSRDINSADQMQSDNKTTADNQVEQHSNNEQGVEHASAVKKVDAAEASPNTEVTHSDEHVQPQSQDDAYQQHSDAEQTLASQFDDIMSSAVDQGFNEHTHTTHVEPDVNSQNSEPHTSIAQQESQAQSAIARILRDRNISGAGKLSGANIKSTQTTEQPVTHAAQNSSKPEPQAPLAESQPQQAAQRQSATIDAPPWSNDDPGQTVKKPALPETGSQTRSNNQVVTKKVDFKEKHQTITENLAPELLEQINPQKKPEVVTQEPSIPVPDDFQSPISEIRFAHQQDEWAYLIKRMGLGGRMRQFALHSIFTKQGNNLHIDVDESQKHLDTPMLRQKLDAALSSIYEHNVTLSINFAQGVIDSPYLIQQKIDVGRHQQAIDVITSDENIVQFQQLFSAIIDENSIQAL